MGRIKHQAFLDLEETLAKRLRNAWSRYWGQVSAEIRSALDRGDFDSAHRLAEAIDLAPLFNRSRTFARTVGMSALLLGASRIRRLRDSRIKNAPPIKELDAFLRQLDTMLSRNASQKLRDMAHAWVHAEETKLLKADTAEPLYVCRRLLNTESFVAWAKAQGFTQVDEDLHVTVMYSQAPVEWSAVTPDTTPHTVIGGPRSVEALGDQGAVVLKIDSPLLHDRWQAFRDAGCSWDYDGYQPHVTITYTKPEGLDLGAVTPFTGALEFGPEDFEPLSTDEEVEKFDPSQPRHPKGTPEGGQWVDMKVTEHPSDIYQIKVVVPGETKLDPEAIKVEAERLDDGIHVRLSVAADTWQGAGLGVRAYAKLADYAHSKGLPLFSDTSVSHDAVRMYQALEKRGYTVERHPLAVEDSDGLRVRGGRWVFRVTNPTLVKGEVAKLDPGADRNQVKINVAGKQYFGIAASVQVSRLSAFGFLLEAAEAGITNYRVDAVLDERTCAVCKQMDGWVFPLEAGLKQAQLIMDTDDPDTLKQIAPFYAQNKQAVAELITYSTDDWIDRGMNLPPYHPLCRCILTPTEEEADVHPTQQSDRVAIASQTLYGEGEGVRLTRELFGIEQPTEADRRSLGDVIPQYPAEPEEVAAWLDLITDSGQPPPAPPKVDPEAWIKDLVQEWLTQPVVDIRPEALITPTPFEGTTVPQQYAKPFEPSRLAEAAKARWPWLAGILGWLAVAERDQFPPSNEEAELEAEEAEADAERDERNELREDRRR